MKKNSSALAFVALALLFPPAAFSQGWGMDEQYNQSLMGNQGTQAQAGAGEGVNAWSDSYLEAQQKAVQVPGTLRAPLERGSGGTVATYKGNYGQYLKGKNLATGNSLPSCQTGLNAINGGYTGAACGLAGSGGFSASGYSWAPDVNNPNNYVNGVWSPDPNLRSNYQAIYDSYTASRYPGLPPTATSSVDLNTAF